MRFAISALFRTTPLINAARPKAISTYVPLVMRKFSTYNGIDFEQVSPNIEIHRPKDAKPDAPIVFVLGWLDGKMRYISKYATPYAEIMPGSTIVMRTVAKWEFLYKHDVLAQETDELLNALPALTDGSSPRILVHSFSNGGLATLGSFFKRMHERKGAMSPIGHIMDCSPGRMTSDASKAFTVGSEDRPTKKMSTILFVRALTAYRRITGAISGRPEFLDDLRRKANSPEAWMTHSLLPRLYLYTENDTFINPDDVEEHARDALAAHRKQGVPRFEPEKTESIDWPPLADKPVRLCRWVTPTHVSIARHDPKNYWGNVKRFIEEASVMENGPRAKL
ncbi:hypothetical protein MCUN1_002535 [Malassezia cuniculi]|uniref:Transmembrane protein 53 n=1 Tax=Malassezia cuniculi TaxID=948313 RepID=A0AAF0EW56_9BASI|nr:hypothetical protein MCUN1_002535 [Malassezia cuniculi]